MMMKPESKFVLITGASTGIGYGVAQNKFVNWTLPMLLPQRALDYIFKKLM
jgi:NADP-dependent 3-hydroxy acid dehydrogenase YdfG